MRRRALVVLPLLLASCRTGRGPEGLTADVSIPGVHRLIAADALTRAMLNRGFRVQSLDDKEAVFARLGDSLPAAMLVGASRANAPESRVRCALVEEDGGVRIVATLSTVSNAGARFEHSTSPSGDDLERVRDALAAVKARLTRKASPAPAARRTPAPAERSEEREELEAPVARAEPKPRSEPKAKPEPDSDSKSSKTKGDWDQDGDDMLEELRRRAMKK